MFLINHTEKLGKAIDKVYSKDASKLIDQQNKLLEQQKVLILQQIREENDKKKTDKDRIKDWQDQIDEINNAISDNKEAGKDAIFGSDIKSAIEDFANAYADAWAAGEDKAQSAKDLVRKMIRDMVTESDQGRRFRSHESHTREIARVLVRRLYQRLGTGLSGSEGAGAGRRPRP